MIIKILGSGCTNCVNLERVTRQAVADLGIDAQFEKVTDFPAILGYGVMSTPGLVVDEKVVLSGRVPTAAKVRPPLLAMVELVKSKTVYTPWGIVDLARSINPRGGTPDVSTGDLPQVR